MPWRRCPQLLRARLLVPGSEAQRWLARLVPPARLSVVAADGVVGDAAWLFNKRTCPSRAMSLSSRSRIFCWSAALSDCPDAACEVPLCCGYAGMAAINEITASNPIRKLVDIRVMDVNISSSVG